MTKVPPGGIAQFSEYFPSSQHGHLFRPGKCRTKTQCGSVMGHFTKGGGVSTLLRSSRTLAAARLGVAGSGSDETSLTDARRKVWTLASVRALRLPSVASEYFDKKSQYSLGPKFGVWGLAFGKGLETR